MVFSLAWHFLRDRAVAEELSQDVFFELHRNIGRLGSESHIRFWLRQVTSRRCIDESRRRKLRPKFGLNEVPEPAAVHTERDPMLSETLRRLMAGLPERARFVVLLRYQEDLEPLEIAQVLEMPIATVKSHLRRSLALFRARLAPKECIHESRG